MVAVNSIIKLVSSIFEKPSHFTVVLFFIGVQLLYTAVSVSAVQQSESAVCIHISCIFKFSSHLGHQRAPSRVPCAVQQVLISYVFYTQQCIYVNPNLPIHPTLPSFPLGIHTFFSLRLCLYFCFANKIIYTIFLDSTLASF